MAERNFPRLRYHDQFTAMNTEIDVVLLSDSEPIDLFLSVRLLFGQQEGRFSRFSQDSLVSRLNRGERVCDPWIAAACNIAAERQTATGGLFNAYLLEALEAAGYDRTFPKLKCPERRPLPHWRPIEVPVEISGNCIRLRRGRLDGGGFVKGWTVDMAAELLAQECPAGVVNAGGDLRTWGALDGPGGCRVEVDNPLDATTPAWSGMVSAAMGTSSIHRRTWRCSDGGAAHHLIDPRTGLPSRSEYTQVSVQASTALEAETWAKAVLIGGRPALEVAVTQCQTVVTVGQDGSVRVD